MANAKNSNLPAEEAGAITPSDSTVFNPPYRSLWVGGAGNISVVMSDDREAETTVTFSGIAAGTWMPIRVVKVMATGTTATLIAGVR